MLQRHVLINVTMRIWNPWVRENLKLATENTMQIELEGFHHHNSQQQQSVDPSDPNCAEVQMHVAWETIFKRFTKKHFGKALHNDYKQISNNYSTGARQVNNTNKAEGTSSKRGIRRET